MKLFYSAGVCSLAPHIVLAELNMAYELEAVNLQDKTCASGNYRSINPKGSVPAIRMDNGEILTEGATISQYIADQKPEGQLLGKFGTMERVRTLEWMTYISSEIHKSFSPIFGAERISKTTEGQSEIKNYFKNVIVEKCGFIAEKLGTNDYLCGSQFTIADAYMFTCLSWAKHLSLDLSANTTITNYLKRVSERPGVIRAMKEEGLVS